MMRYLLIVLIALTGLTTGACPDWQVDHVIPRDNGGCDVVSNMQWLPVWLKTCAGHCKDRFERKIYCKPVEVGMTVRSAEPEDDGAGGLLSLDEDTKETLTAFGNRMQLAMDEATKNDPVYVEHQAREGKK